MQKKIIALAVAGLMSGAAFAQSNVTISGLAKVGYDNYKITNSGYSTEDRISDQSSRIIFKGSEDLGGGLSAIFQIDMRYANDLGGLGATGNTFVGLSSKSMGTVVMGRHDVHYFENGGLEGNRAGSLQTSATNGIMSQNNGTTIAVGTRTPNVTAYISPNMGGFTFKAGVATAAANEGSGLADGSDGSGANVVASYSAGGLAAGLSYFRLNAEGGAVGDQRSTRAWAGYSFPMGLKVGLVWDSNKLERAVGTTTKRNAWAIPVTFTMGNNSLYFTYARAGDLSGTSNTGANQYTLGFDHALSKRTSVGVFYTKLNNDRAGTYDMFGMGASGGTTTAAGQDARQLYAGIAHSF